MSRTNVPPPSIAEMNSTLCELRAESILWILPALWLASLIFYMSASYSIRASDPILACLATFLVGALVWVLRRFSYRASVGVLISGSIGIVLLMVRGMQLTAAFSLLALPTGLAVLFAGITGGALTAAFCTVLVLAAPAAMGVNRELAVMATVNIWSTVGLIWLAQRPLLTALQWSWSSTSHSLHLLKEARDQRLQLREALASLGEANAQLARLNQITQGLRQAADDARRAKEQFVANVSHELRTPLNMIIGFIEMVTQSPESYGGRIPAALLADLKIVLRNGQHLASLIDDVLDLSQIEAGRMALVKERTSIGEIIQAAMTAVRPLFASKGLYLKVELRDNPTLFCDRTRIRETLLNLLSNAGRFTEQGGVCIACWQENDEVAISVADTGPGIAPADRNRLFVPFEQLDASVRRRHGGTGLGLAISKSFVELHGGQMWLESEEGQGTTFRLRLPIDSLIISQGSAARWIDSTWEYRERVRHYPTPAPSLHRRAITVEAGHSLRRLITRYMDGMEVTSTSNLEEALQALSEHPAQPLIINSTSIPGALDQLGKATLPDGAVAIITAIPDLVTAAEALGVSGYLVKPISRDAVLAALDRLHLQGKTILVVDDEPEAQRLFRRMLVSSEHRYRVLRASDGREALTLLREEHVDAVLLDLVMPAMDGFHFLEAKNANPALRDTPVIVLSARDPSGQPIVSDGLAISRAGGLSIPQVLAAIDGLGQILEMTWKPVDQGYLEGPGD